MKKIITFILLTSFYSFSQQENVNIAILDLEAQGIKPFEATTISEKLRHELVRYGKFAVLERNKVNEILKEQGFQRSGCTSTECIVEIGQLIGVQKIVTGTVGVVGETYLIIVRLIDVKTGKIIKTATEETVGKIDNLLKIGIANVARELSGFDKIKTSQSNRHEKTEEKLSFAVYYDEEPERNYEVIYSGMTDSTKIDDEKELRNYKRKAIDLGGDAIIFKKMLGIKKGDSSHQNYQVKVIKRY